MTVDPRSDGRRGVGALLRDLAESSAGLIRAEARLVRIELGDAARLAGRGTAFVALGGVLLLLGALAALTALILLIGDQWLPHDLYWLGALLVALIPGRIASWAAIPAPTALSPSALPPRETASTLKEDREWLKQRVT